MTSNPQSYASAALTSSDSRELTGTEAYAARCAMVSMPSSFDHSTPAPKLKMEDAMDVDTPSMHVSRTLSSVQVKREPMEEREIQGDYHHSTLLTANSPTREHLTTATRVSSTMYPTPRPLQPPLHPPHQSRSSQVSPVYIGENDQIPGLDPQDLLDRRIGIRPRNKSSAEVQLILSNDWSRKSGKQKILPEKIQKIVHQFMVANRFIAPSNHIPNKESRALTKSLLLRLDIHVMNPKAQKPSLQQRRLASAASKVSDYIISQTRIWKDMGILIQTSNIEAPVFHRCAKHWVYRSWNGKISMNSSSTVDAIADDLPSWSYDDLLFVQDRVRIALQKKGGVLPASIESRPPDSQRSDDQWPIIQREHYSIGHSPIARRPLGQLTMSAMNASGFAGVFHDSRSVVYEEDYIPGSALDGGKPSYSETNTEALAFNSDLSSSKYLREDTLDASVSKRKRVSSPLTEEGLAPYEKGLARVIESIHLAHGCLADTAPTTAKDLASLQQNWQYHGHGSCLAQSLQLGQSCTGALSKYFDTALELLSVLAEPTSAAKWRVGAEGVEVDCGCAAVCETEEEEGRVSDNGRLYSPSQAPCTPFKLEWRCILDAQLGVDC